MTRMLAPSPARRRFARRAALVVVAGAGATTLAACQKPLPDVTFQSGSRSVLVEPSNYCFDADKRDSCHGEGGVKTLQAAPGDTINISVPRTVALNAWVVTANDVDDSGTLQVIDGAGSAVVTDSHHARVQVPTQGTAPYLLTVAEYRGNTATGAWTIQVNIRN